MARSHATGGLFLKGLQWFLRGIEFCCAAIILGICSYYLATLHNHDLPIANYIRAVEGISGAAVVYTMIGLLLLCFLAGIAIASTIAILLDLAFSGAFIYVAWALRGGAGSCSGQVDTPFGSGDTNSNKGVSNGSGGFTQLPSLYTACRLETAAFAVAIIACVFFILSIFVELALIRHHKKEKAFGPSPNNGYTAGSPRRRFWRRKSRRDVERAEKNPDALPPHTTPADTRTSYATDVTAVGTQDPVYDKYGNTAMPLHHNQAAGVSPYTSGVPTEVSGHHGYHSNPTGAF